MSPSNSQRAVALKYENGEAAPVIVASGMGYLAERIVDIASESGVPVYEDNSLATMLSQLELGAEIPEELYKAIVEIYVYFLNFNPNQLDGKNQVDGKQKAQDDRQKPTAEAEVAYVAKEK